jgi:murein DD-endopeptidase MepM/ murein hydrolase activator NlpD
VTDLAQVGVLGEQPMWMRGWRGRSSAGQFRANAALALATSALVGCTALALCLVHYQRIANTQADAMLQIARANGDLQDELARTRDRLAAVSQTLNLAQSKISALHDEAQRQVAASQEAEGTKADRVAQLGQALEQAQRELHLTAAQRVTLMARLSKAESDLADKQARQQKAEAGLDQWQRKVEQLSTERDQLRARVDALEQKLSQSHPAQAPHPVAEATPTVQPQPRQAMVVVPHAAPSAPAVAAVPAPPAASAAPQAVVIPQVATAEPVARGVPSAARTSLAQVERVLASAGVDVRRLFAEVGVRQGLGGPFVPARDTPATQVDTVQLAALPGLVKTLPVAVPMAAGYRETSPFGERRDPFNGRPAFHPGIDLAAPYGAPIYATAGGTVTYAGYRSDYGKIVEIDHGHGIVSRYSHLSRYVVNVGQRVPAGAEIGYEGSTGRSTGPHLLYEIDVNGEPQDPAKFFSLASLAR